MLTVRQASMFNALWSRYITSMGCPSAVLAASSTRSSSVAAAWAASGPLLASPEASLFYGVYLYMQAFRQFNFGFASAMAWLLFVIIMIISLVQVRVGNRFVYYEGDR